MTNEDNASGCEVDIELEELEELTDEKSTKPKRKGGGVRETQFLQEIEGFQIFRTSTSFALKLPNGKFGGYYTSLGAMFREMVKICLYNKLLKRPAAERKQIESFCKVVKEHEDFTNELAKKFDKFVLGLTIK